MNRVVKEVTISQCIKNWEHKTGKKISEEENVSFICNIPLIEKLDQSINTLEKCKRLSLSTNRIEKFVPMSGLKILSIGRNCIKKLQFLEDISGTLKQLWISYNNIDKLDNLQSLKNLQVLYLFHNKIKCLEEIDKLNTLPELIELGLKGNPIYEGRTNEYMKLVILKKLPQLKVVDNETITEKQRNDALTIEVV
ncbi:dynein light chain 1, putative [Plasmodium yoelii]|uniref:Dynein axonemal light chain 1 n=1 Tax=Plasmodium yoelii TaxID=5861 RepID=A0A077Y2Y2_PLAYE|nr:dynein light chain 1, putative [Plasmodium yoelii]CDU17204.1 dynein light chain 1, putative [Plasmodium yoelii]VTZ76347.1 dynein light chain 1, putative [Plasmodium yoelii]|eukprot:XP_022811772.1 dynein light chain 1, putative [Plasmodium yoelii]